MINNLTFREVQNVSPKVAEQCNPIPEAFKSVSQKLIQDASETFNAGYDIDYGSLKVWVEYDIKKDMIAIIGEVDAKRMVLTTEEMIATEQEITRLIKNALLEGGILNG